MSETITFEKQLEIGNAQTIGYTYVPYTSCYNPRLYLQCSSTLTTALMATLNKLSNWGGIDKRGENYVSWELPRHVNEQYMTDAINGYYTKN